MLLNSPFYLCSNFKQEIEPLSSLYHLQTVPKNVHLTSNKSFLFCDTENNKTFIKEFQIETHSSATNNFIKEKTKSPTLESYTKLPNSKEDDEHKILTIDEIDGTYTTHAFTDDSVLFLNRAGDFFYFNLLNKNIFTSEKQHPGLFSDAEILTIEGYFLTCGGCVKNPINSQSERIIKVWKINEEEDKLELQSRINTGHSKDIESSFLLNNSKVVTLSSDKSVRLSNLCTESVEKIINVNQDLFAGCSIDYNTIIVGGIGKQLRIYDTRTSKALMRPVKIPGDLVQITKIIRFNENNLLMANINELLTLDMRQMNLVSKAKTEGERISELTVINREHFIVGNKDKTLQIWKAF